MNDDPESLSKTVREVLAPARDRCPRPSTRRHREPTTRESANFDPSGESSSLPLLLGALSQPCRQSKPTSRVAWASCRTKWLGVRLRSIAHAVEHMNMSTQRRAFARLLGDRPVEVFWDERIIRAELCDISVGGAAFYVDKPGDARDLLLILNPSESCHGLLMSRIENIPKPGRSLVRAQFAQLDQRDTLYLADYLQSLETEHESRLLASRFASQRPPRL